MKKQISLVAAVLFSAGMILITGCAKDDTTPPVVTLVGNSSLTFSLNTSASSAADPGATAEDDEDGDITSSITSDWSTKVNLNLKGSYTVTYSVTDAAGNEGAETRTVNVVNDAEAMAGAYNCTIAAPNAYGPYPQTITASTTKNNRIHFSKFGDYDNNTGIFADVTGTNIDLPTQIANQVGTPPANRTFSGTGTTNSTGFTLTYTETIGANSTTYTETFVKQ